MYVNQKTLDILNLNRTIFEGENMNNLKQV